MPIVTFMRSYVNGSWGNWTVQKALIEKVINLSFTQARQYIQISPSDYGFYKITNFHATVRIGEDNPATFDNAYRITLKPYSKDDTFWLVYYSDVNCTASVLITAEGY